MQADKKIMFEEPGNHIVIEGDEILRLDHIGVEVVGGLIVVVGRDKRQELRERGDTRSTEDSCELFG